MLKGFKTYLFNFALIISAVFSFIEQNSSIVTDFFTDPIKVKLAVLVIGCVGVALRTATHTAPMQDK